MGKRWLVRAGAAALLLGAGVLAVIAYQSLQAPLSGATGGATPPGQGCSPTPCRNVQGFTLWVSNVTVDGNLVRMRVMFKNSSAATHASPDDLSLIDSGHHTSKLATDASDCNTWTRHVFNNGATFGPIDICFHVTDTTPPFTLRWTPDLGFFCCDTSLPVSPT